MIGFAHRGAPSMGIRENTLAAFTRVLEHGGRALESDVWLTDDGITVLDHDGVVRSRLRRQPICTLPATALPKWIPTLDELYRRTGGDFELCLDVKDPAAAVPVIDVAQRHAAAGRLWLCGSVAQVRGWRPAAGPAHLVVSTSLRPGNQRRGPAEERIEEAAESGADALNLRAPEWSADRVQRCHDRRMLAFAWDVQQRATLERMRAYGCDAIFSDFVTLVNAA
jgi:glycerophosphoryl diester phosphodiesterase